MVEETEEYQNKWHGHVERMPPGLLCRGKHTFITFLENETLNVREDVGQNMSFNLGMGHD
jgi:hypothetical protein